MSTGKRVPDIKEMLDTLIKQAGHRSLLIPQTFQKPVRGRPVIRDLLQLQCTGYVLNGQTSPSPAFFGKWTQCLGDLHESQMVGIKGEESMQ